MSKQYGLIIPGKEKKEVPTTFSKPAIFGDSSESDEERPSRVGTLGPGDSQKRHSRLIQEKALEEDPTVFQYDELYDDMENKKKEEQQTKKKVEDRKPKYIARLLQTAEKRKKEYERQIERQVQKERLAEGEKFKDKESFVTSSYKKKLEELRETEENEKRAEYLESIGDVRKQGNLDGFYRHLYEQKVGDEPSSATVEAVDKKKDQEKKERQYRKRKSSEEPPEDTSTATVPRIEKESTEEVSARVHLQSNLDADSDFSIDSSDSEEEEKEPEKPVEATVATTTDSEVVKADPSKDTFVSPIPNIVDKSSAPDSNAKAAESESAKEIVLEEKESEEPVVKKPKINIWLKRTVGEVFDAAVQRYYERKASKAG